MPNGNLPQLQNSKLALNRKNLFGDIVMQQQNYMMA